MFCLWLYLFRDLDMLSNRTDSFPTQESREAAVRVFLVLDSPDWGLFRPVPWSFILVTAGTHVPVAHESKALPQIWAEVNFSEHSCLFFPL